MDKHTPDPAFLDRLEARVVSEARRQRQAPAPAGSWVASRLRLTIAAASIAIVSMGVGAVGVAAAYQVQTNAQRDLLSADLQRRIDLAGQRLRLASDQLQAREKQVSVGLATAADVIDARAKVVAAQTALEVLQSQLAEVRITGRDAVDSLSAPVASGRDFVAERLKMSGDAQRTDLETAQSQLIDAEKKFQIGIGSDIDVAAAKSRIVQLQALLEALQEKMELRHQFVSGRLDAAQTDLRTLAVEARQRQTGLQAQLEVMQERLLNVSKQVSVGQAQSVDLAEARLNLQQVQTDLAKAALDRELVCRQLATLNGSGC